MSVWPWRKTHVFRTDLTDAEKIDRLLNKNMALLELWIGCDRHPSYRAKRRPRADCGKCSKLWELSEQMSVPAFCDPIDPPHPTTGDN